MKTTFTEIKELNKRRKDILKLEFTKIYKTTDYHVSDKYECGFTEIKVIKKDKFQREIELDYLKSSKDYLFFISNGKKIKTSNDITELQQKLIDNNLIDNDTHLSNFSIEIEKR